MCAGAGGWEDADRLRQGPALRSQPGVAWTEISFAGLPRPRRLVVEAPLAPSYYAAPRTSRIASLEIKTHGGPFLRTWRALRRGGTTPGAIHLGMSGIWGGCA